VVVVPLVTVVTVAQTRRFVQLIPEALSPNRVVASGSIFMSERAAFMGLARFPKKPGGQKWPKRTPGGNPGQKEEENSRIALA
jgi:hypothetical protein